MHRVQPRGHSLLIGKTLLLTLRSAASNEESLSMSDCFPFTPVLCSKYFFFQTVQQWQRKVFIEHNKKNFHLMNMRNSRFYELNFILVLKTTVVKCRLPVDSNHVLLCYTNCYYCCYYITCRLFGCPHCFQPNRTFVIYVCYNRETDVKDQLRDRWTQHKNTVSFLVWKLIPMKC